jgi:DNA-binding response OmpR family regulator
MTTTVLIVEDEADLASLHSDVLHEAGYDVVLTTGTAAVERTVDVKPGLILMDYVMPGLDGAAVIAQLRERLSNQLPPLVLVSGRPEVRELARQVGADGYLYKPFDVDELLSLVSRLGGRDTHH